MTTIYILELNNDKFYVGKTTNTNLRIQQHFSASGSAWTRKYKPVRIIDQFIEKDTFDEDKHTLQYMCKYGIDNVRGGSFCQVVLTKETQSIIEKMIHSRTDTCYECGETGHYINQCKARNNACQSPTSRPITRSATRSAILLVDHKWFCTYCGKEFTSARGAQCHENLYCRTKKQLLQTPVSYECDSSDECDSDSSNDSFKSCYDSE